MIHRNLFIFALFVAFMTGTCFAVDVEQPIDVTIDDKPVQFVAVDGNINAVVEDKDGELYSFKRDDATDTAGTSCVQVWIE